MNSKVSNIHQGRASLNSPVGNSREVRELPSKRMARLRTARRSELPSAPLCAPIDRYTYHVIASAARMPASCWGRYGRVAIVRVDHHERPLGYVPERIVNLRGVRVVSDEDRLSRSSENSGAAFARALGSAHEAAENMRQLRRSHASREE